jgi:peptidylprolyl isomerase
MFRFALVALVVAACSKEGPKTQANPSSDPATETTAESPTGPRRTGKVDLAVKKPTAEATSHGNLPPEANPPGAPVLSGELKNDRDVRYIDEVVGAGPSPVKNKKVSVHYTGWLTSGKSFDSSRERDQPIEFPFDSGMVIKGWDIGLSSMKVGGKRRIIIPAELAYGDRDMGDTIPAGSMLVFDVELMAAEQ